jgi:uncharacterized protein YecT (DUF1311 family)
MSELMKGSGTVARLVIAGWGVGLVLNAGLPAAVWSQTARPPQATSTTPSPAQLRTFRNCLDVSVDQEGWKQCGDPIYDECNQKSGMPDSTLAVSECLMMVHTTWDINLNRIYQTTLSGQSPSTRTLLRAAQRTWVTGRKADCDAVYEANIGGSIRTIAYASCMVDATRERYNWLARFDQQ